LQKLLPESVFLIFFEAYDFLNKKVLGFWLWALSLSLRWQVLYGQLLLNPPGPEGSKGRWLSGAI
jgi:hypothetical protein